MTTPSEEEAREAVVEKPNGDLHVTDVLGRTATLHWSRFHGLIVASDSVAVYLGQPETLAWLASRVSTPPAAEPKETPDDSEINDAIKNADDWFDALWEIATKYDVPVTNNSPRWQDGRFLRPIAEFIADIDDAAKKWQAVSTPPSEDWEYGWKYAQPLTQADWRTVYPYKVHQAMVQVRRRIVPQSEWEVVPASPAPLSSEYAAGPQGDAIRASKATTGSTAVPVLPTEPEMRMLMTHPHDGHGPNDTCRLCAPTEPEEKR